VRARIDAATKERAADALASMGLSISNAIRHLMLRIADERRLRSRTIWRLVRLS
jgi:DNA-damage-inducible protein J